jgi:hypothetical protein
MRTDALVVKRVLEEGTVELNATPRRFEHHSFWLTASIEENGSTSGSGTATTFRFWQQWAGENGGTDAKGQTFTVQGNSEHREFFALMQRIGRALGYLDAPEVRR